MWREPFRHSHLRTEGRIFAVMARCPPSRNIGLKCVAAFLEYFLFGFQVAADGCQFGDQALSSPSECAAAVAEGQDRSTATRSPQRARELFCELEDAVAEPDIFWLRWLAAARNDSGDENANIPPKMISTTQHYHIHGRSGSFELRQSSRPGKA